MAPTPKNPAHDQRRTQHGPRDVRRLAQRRDADELDTAARPDKQDNTDQVTTLEMPQPKRSQIAYTTSTATVARTMATAAVTSASRSRRPLTWNAMKTHSAAN